MREVSLEARRGDKEVVLVPTMGFLHEGHLALVDEARSLGDLVVVSIFVNPAQFGPAEDLESYPTALDEDKAKLRARGVDVLFIPSVESIYPDGFSTYVDVEGLSDKLCGRNRPGHFQGVTTIVSKLFNIVTPEKAVFGLKDFQQQLIIRRMVADLDMNVEIVSIETVREADGLALSSRNSYLTGDERRAAAVIPRALRAAREAVRDGELSAEAIREKVKKIMEAEPLIVIDYVSVCSAEDLTELDDVYEAGTLPQTGEGALLAIAVKVGKARLIDNLRLKA